MILQLVRTDLTLLGVSPNLSTAIQGLILIAVVLVGSVHLDATGAAMTAAAGQVETPRPAGRWRRSRRCSAIGRSSP